MTGALVAEGVALVESAQHEGATLRLLGGAAVVVHSSGVPYREIGDLDAVTGRKDVKRLTAVLQGRGYEPETRFNALHGDRRLIFQGPAGKLDVFVDRFEMCHRLELGPRLALDSPTIPVSDLLVTKLQVVELNEKDARDIIYLLSALPLGGQGVSLDTDRYSKLLGADWGWWRTVTGNLAKLPGLIAEKPELVPVNAAYDPREQIQRLSQLAADAPKSVKWRLRSNVGDRVRWYELPEEVAH